MKLEPFSLLAVTLCAANPPLAFSPLQTAVREARFDHVIDFGPANEDRDIKLGSAKTIACTPKVDVAVI